MCESVPAESPDRVALLEWKRMYLSSRVQKGAPSMTVAVWGVRSTVRGVAPEARVFRKGFRATEAGMGALESVKGVP
jgi:hypothetical protein